MQENTITCPNCSTIINLEEAQAKKYNELLKENELKLKKDFEKKEEEIKKEMWIKAQKAAEEKNQIETKDLLNQLDEFKKKQDEAIKNELDLRKKTRELEDKAKSIEIENARKLDEEKKKLEKELEQKLKELSKKEFDDSLQKQSEEFRKKELEYQKQQEQMKKTIDDLKRKSEQGSQQIQGDIQEDDLKNILSQTYPIDLIEDVPTGVKGADLIQSVNNNLGQKVGLIVWESKNTKTWQDSWLMKLKEDKLKINGNIAILVSNTLPNGVKSFAMIDDVMVCAPEFIIPVSSLLRDKILSISKVEKSLEGKDIKMEMLYKYLSSEEFSSKIFMMVDVFANLKSGIDSERRAMEKNWKKREKDLERASFAVTGMYGELESLMGQSLPGSDRLELGSGEEEIIDDE